MKNAIVKGKKRALLNMEKNALSMGIPKQIGRRNAAVERVNAVVRIIATTTITVTMIIMTTTTGMIITERCVTAVNTVAVAADAIMKMAKKWALRKFLPIL